MMSDLTIGGTSIGLGEQKGIDLSISKLYDFTEITMPIKVIRGRQDGPRLFVCAAIHGDEINGVEIIRRLNKHKALKSIKGTLILAPIVNAQGFNSLSRYLPDRRDLNRCFPGTPNGSLTSRLAHVFVKEVLENSTHGIDLHTGAIHRSNLSQIRACLHDKETKKMALEFDVPVIIDAAVIDGSLRKAAMERKIPFLVFEGGEALRYDEVAIRSGLMGILSVMRKLGMIEQSLTKAKKVQSFVSNNTAWVRAPHSGILVVKKRLGSVINPEDVLGVISDPLGTTSTKVKATSKGVIIGYTRLPLVNRGDALFHVATLEKMSLVKKSIDIFDDRFDYEER